MIPQNGALADRPVILVVEDEPVNSALYKHILEPAGYNVTFTASLLAARNWLAAHLPDLVLLDRRLPDGSGLDLSRDLKAQPRTAEVPVLLVTASVLPEDRAAADAAGIDGFVAKPIRVALLLAEIEQRLASRQIAMDISEQPRETGTGVT